MWSRQLCGVVHQRHFFQRFKEVSLNIIIALQVPQPSGDLCAVEAHFPTYGGGQSFGEDLGQCLPFEVHVSLGVAHGCVDIRMAEPMADGCKIDPGLEQIDCGRVPQGVRVQPFAQPRRSASEPLRQIFTK